MHSTTFPSTPLFPNTGAVSSSFRQSHTINAFRNFLCVCLLACLLAVVEVYASEHCRYEIGEALCDCFFSLLMFGVSSLVHAHNFSQHIMFQYSSSPTMIAVLKTEMAALQREKHVAQKGLRHHKGVKTPAASQLQNEMVLVSTVEVVISHLLSTTVLFGCPVSCCHKWSLDEFGCPVESLSDMLCACSNKSLTMLLGKKMLVPWC